MLACALAGCSGVNGPTLPPADAGKIAFASSRDGNSELYTMNPDGSETVRLTDNDDTDTRPSLSVDHRRVVFESSRELADAKSVGKLRSSRALIRPRHDLPGANLYLLRLDATGRPEAEAVQLTNTNRDFAPAINRDGSRIVFRSEREDNSDIFLMPANGGEQTNLTTNAADDLDPDFSPGGGKIVFASNRGGLNFAYDIYTMNDSGGDLVRLTANAGANLGPVWSPDGRQIAFWSNRSGHSAIYVMNAALNADGSMPAPTLLTTGVANDRFPSWSPDGRAIVFQTDRDGILEIYAVDVLSRAIYRITNNNAEDDFPDWR